jgi:hypothetical protein
MRVKSSNQALQPTRVGIYFALIRTATLFGFSRRAELVLVRPSVETRD